MRFGVAPRLTRRRSSCEVPLALLAFNVGIELGQLAFVALALLLGAALQAVAWPSWVRELPAVGIGALGVYWCLERLAEMARLAG
jgi:hypothetical protein